MMQRIWWRAASVLSAIGLVMLATVLVAQQQKSLKDSIRLVGRFDVTNEMILAEWPGSLIEIRIEGVKLDVTIVDHGSNSIIVEVNGNPRRLDLQQGENTYQIINEEEPSLHIVRLIKITEATFGQISLNEISAEGDLIPPIQERRRVLSIGDSISAGYGIQGTDTSCGFEPRFENQYLTFPAVAARYLSADVITLASSGAGLVRNFDGGTSGTMGQLVYKLMPSSSATAPLPRAEVVVLHLGTNDFADGARPDGFGEAYEELLSDIRNTSPDAIVYAAIGPMLRPEDQDAADAAIQEAVAAQQSYGDNNVFFIRFSWEMRPEDFGCDWHPSAVAHARMADELADRIRSDTEWGSLD